MKAMPTYQMEALAYHEGVPGHHMQLAIQQELKDIPKFRKFGGYTAYIEGWGLYSEYLPKEFGAYKDPYSDFGRLAMELWRACRLVVDTLGRLNPIGIVLAGLLMALTYIGGDIAQSQLQLPAAAIQVFQGMLLFFLLALDVLTDYRVQFFGSGESA